MLRNTRFSLIRVITTKIGRYSCYLCSNPSKVRVALRLPGFQFVNTSLPQLKSPGIILRKGIEAIRGMPRAYRINSHSSWSKVLQSQKTEMILRLAQKNPWLKYYNWWYHQLARICLGCGRVQVPISLVAKTRIILTVPCQEYLDTIDREETLKRRGERRNLQQVLVGLA